MINTIKVVNYKCLDPVELKFGNLNIITGLNSTGKSSLIQSILDYCKAVRCHNLRLPFLPDNFNFKEVRNMYKNAREIEITINGESLIIKEEAEKFSNGKPPENFPTESNGLYHLSAARVGPSDLYIYKKGTSDITGDKGELIFSAFENKGNEPIAKELGKCKEDSTVAGNVNLWLGEILGFKIYLNSEIVSANTLKINYKLDEFPIGISPLHLGAGVSYLAQVIILCLLAKPGEIVIIENPEIHLHPEAQSKLGEFFAFMASKGVQIIIETHCEHLINRIRYEVGCKRTINGEQVKIFYKAENREPFVEIGINSYGSYINNKEEEIPFPKGFFDATLDKLMELY